MGATLQTPKLGLPKFAGPDTTSWLTDFNGAMDKIDNIIDFFYPVGSYYETSNPNFDPNASWGGTWVEDSKGYVTVGQTATGTFTTIGATGGSEKHTLTTSEMPQHQHSYVKPPTTTNAHTLTVQQIPAHGHIVGDEANSGHGLPSTYAAAGGTAFYKATRSNEISNTRMKAHDTGGGQGHSHNITNTDAVTTATGGYPTSPHNNLQPYVVVKRWHRTA